MNFRPAARAAGAALVLAPAFLGAQTSTKVVNLGGTDYTMTAKSLVSAAGDVNNDPRYSTPVSPAYNGVGSVRITSNLGVFICTGSLLPDGQTVLTAAHCLTGDIGTVSAISVNFYPVNSTAVVMNAASWTANPNYSGEVIDENDVGVIRLNAVADPSITRYQLYTGVAENNNFEFVGFGQRGSFGTGTGGAGQGAGFGLGNRRNGDNLFDITLGDSRWEGFFDDPFADVGHVLLADFDNGTTGFNSNDGMCWIGRFSNFPTMGMSECNAGRGLDEAISGGGDSGGPGFINGQIASITSFGLTFGQSGTGFGDIDNALNSSFGEYAGFTDVEFQSAWINSQLVVTPEPGSMVLMASGLIGIAGIARRRRNKKA